MKNTRTWALQSFTACVFFNAILGIIIFFLADKLIIGLLEWVVPFLSPGAPGMSDEARAVIGNTGVFLTQLRISLAPALASVTAASTLLLWLTVYFMGRRIIVRASAPVVCTPPSPENPETGGHIE